MNEYLEILNAAWKEHLKPKDVNAPTVISIFAGGGGSSLGYSMAGYKELLAIDFDKNSIDTLRLNFPDLSVLHKDICEISADEIMEITEIEKGNLNILDGSPPCQGFSTAGKRKLADNRNNLFQEYVRLLNDLQPEMFIMENVSGMVKGKMKLVFIEILKSLKSCGYQVKCKLLNAMYFNVPQSRQRLIFFGIRNDMNIMPTFPQSLRRPFTVKDAFEKVNNINKDINDLDIKRFALYNKIKRLKPGQCIADLPEQKSGYTCLKLRWNKYSPTICKSQEHISSHDGFIHPSEHRKITIPELKRLGSFPDEYQFTDWKNGWHRIGNSVPPLFMKTIAEHIRYNILDKMKQAA